MEREREVTKLRDESTTRKIERKQPKGAKVKKLRRRTGEHPQQQQHGNTADHSLKHRPTQQTPYPSHRRGIAR